MTNKQSSLWTLQGPCTGFRMLLLAVFAATSLTVSQAQPALEQALSALQAEDHPTALRLLDRIKQENPRKAAPYFYSARAMLEDGRADDAASELALMPPPVDFSAPQLLEVARLLSRLDQKRPAADLLESLSGNPQLPAQGLWFLSELRLDLKEFDKALTALKAYALRSPADPRILLREGKLLVLAGQLEAALTTLEKIVEAHPEQPEGYYEMARTLRFGNNSPAAKEVIALAIEKKGPHPDYLHLQGIIAADLGEFESAVKSFEQANKLEGAPSRIYFDLGNAHRRLGNREESRAALSRYQELFRAEEALKNRGQSIVQLVNQGTQQLHQGDAGAARASFLRALELDPHHYQARASLIQIYLSSGTLAQAREELLTLRKVEPRSADTSFFSAFLHYQEKNLAEALRAAKTSRRLRPGNPELRNLLGNVYFAQGRLQEALAEYRAAMRLAPDQLAYRANYQTLARRLGKPDP